jgi:hypothetical protein
MVAVVCITVCALHCRRGWANRALGRRAAAASDLETARYYGLPLHLQQHLQQQCNTTSTTTTAVAAATAAAAAVATVDSDYLTVDYRNCRVQERGPVVQDVPLLHDAVLWQL